MLNKKDEPNPATAKKKYALSIRRKSSADKQHPTTGEATATGSGAMAPSPRNSISGSSPSSSYGPQLLASAPKANESPVKQALVVHHANIQQISVNWFKLIAEQMDAIKRMEEANAAKGQTGNGKGCKADGALKANNSSSAQKASEHIVTAGETAQSVRKPSLIHPTEVQVFQQIVQEQPQIVLTPVEDAIECLRRHDEIIEEALQDKRKILSEMFELQEDEMEQLSESILENKIEAPSARFLVLASMLQRDRLFDAINSSLKVVRDSVAKTPNPPPTEKKPLLTPNSIRALPPAYFGGHSEPPAVPCRQLGLIIPPLLKHLSSILHTTENAEDELKVSRVELLRCKAEAGSCFSLLRESPNGSAHNAVSPKSSQSDGSKGVGSGVAEVQQ